MAILNEYKAELSLLFIDLQQMFDNFKNGRLMSIMKEVGVPRKLRELILMTMESIIAMVEITKGASGNINKAKKYGNIRNNSL